MPEAVKFQDCGETVDFTPAAAVGGGQVLQLPDGRAAVLPVDLAAGALGAAETEGVWTVAKTAGMEFLDGGRVYWDFSANAAHYKKVNDRDFYVGRAYGDAAAAATAMRVNFNVNPAYDIDALGGDGGVLSVATGTQALGGFLPPQAFGNSRALTLSATNEAQCVDLLSVDRFDVNANAIAEVVFRLGANGSSNAVDLNFGIANGTSTTDADAVTEHVFFHVDGGDLSIFCQSKDGTTTVAATDTTVDATAGSAVANRVELWIDTRDPSNVKLYVNGSRVLAGTTFKINAATGPLGLLAHLEKVVGTATAGPVYVDRLAARFQE